MKFEERKVTDAVGWRLAHSVNYKGRKIAKATLLSAELADDLVQNGVTTVQVFQLDAADLDEDTAAVKAATLLAGDGIRVEPAGAGVPI